LILKIEENQVVPFEYDFEPLKDTYSSYAMFVSA